MLYDYCRIWRFASLFVAGLLLILVLAAPFAFAAETTINGYAGSSVRDDITCHSPFYCFTNEQWKQLLIDAYEFQLAIVLGVSADSLYGIYWDDSGMLWTAAFENPYGKVNSSYCTLYPLADLVVVEQVTERVFYSISLAEASSYWPNYFLSVPDWDDIEAKNSMDAYIKLAGDTEWFKETDTANFYYSTDLPSDYDAYWMRSADFKSMVIEFPSGGDSGSPTEPAEPSEPGDSTLPTNPEFDPERPFASTQPIWIRKLDSFAFPDFPLGGDPLTLNVEATSPNGGQILYQWHITGQNADGTIFLNQTSSWGTNSSYDISLEREGIYSVIAYAKNRYNDGSGASVDSHFITTSLRYVVSADGTDSLPDSVTPPYEGWQEDMEQADELNNNIQNNIDDIDGGLEILDSVTMPNIDNIDLNITDLIDANGLNAMNTILGVLWDNNIIMVTMTIAFILAMAGFFIFGKR